MLDSAKWHTINGKAIRMAEPFFVLKFDEIKLFWMKAGERMINLNKTKTRKKIAAIIIFILIIAMLLPSIISIFTV